MQHVLACAVVFIIICIVMSKTDILPALKHHTANLICVTDEPPAKMISPTMVASASAGKSKRARKAATKQRLAQQDLETQSGDASNGDAVVPLKVDAPKKTPATEAAQRTSLSRRNIGANWQQAMAAIVPPANVLKTKKQPLQHPTPPKHLPVNKQGISITKHLSMDCEMVGVGYAAKKHMLARVSIVNQRGEVLMDRFVRPREPVIDYRTHVSGIRPADIANGEEFSRVQAEVSALLNGRILVGHAIYNDLKVLGLDHPPKAIRDTSRYRPLINKITGGATPSLKTLAQCVLDVKIQSGEHSSVEDARAAMRIYNRYQEEWERSVRRRNN